MSQEQAAFPRATVAVILAGGTGSRFGGSEPKQLASLAGQPILYHTLRKLDGQELVGRVVVVGNSLWRDRINDICDSALRKCPYLVVDGGADRNDSVRMAVASLTESDARVLIHDAVRPLATRQLMEAVLDRLKISRSVIPVIPSADPVVQVDKGRVIGFGDRREFQRGQSPQGFWLSDLRKTFLDNEPPVGAYSTVFEAVRSVFPEIEISIVPGEVNNVKITVPVDHMIAGRLLLDE